MKVLVIGSNGQVGCELTSTLTKRFHWAGRHHSVISLGRSHLDLGNLPKISKILCEVAPDVIVNAAAYTAVDLAESNIDMAFTINARAVGEMAKYCHVSRCALIHISTDYVFDGKLSRPYCEHDPVGAVGIYGRSKLAGEIAIRDLLSQHIILRTSWVFGNHGRNFVKTMLRLAGSNDQVSVVSDQVGSPTSSKSIADAIASIILKMGSATSPSVQWGTYHFSGFPHVSWAEFAAEIFEQGTKVGLIDKPPRVIPISATEYPTPAVRPANSRLDCTKVKKTFGIEPDDWKKSLGSMLADLSKRLQS